MAFVALKMGRRQGEERSISESIRDPIPGPRDSRRPVFIATLRAVASWLFFRVARSLRIDPDMLVARALKNRQLTHGESHAIHGTGH
jgi:hypothetical protein